MFCKFCGAKIDDNAIFCSGCGSKVGEDEKTQSAFSEFEVAMNSNSNNMSGDVVNYNVERNLEKMREKQKLHEKTIKILEKVHSIGSVAGKIGVALLVITILLNVLELTFDTVNTVLLLASGLCAVLGVCSFVAKCVLISVFKNGEYPKPMTKKIFMFVGAAVYLICSFFSFSVYYVNYRPVNSSSGETSLVWTFSDVFNECGCSYIWADYGTDYLSIDTNPYNYDSDSSYSNTYVIAASQAIKKVNSKLGLPSYLYDDMMETRALDGKLSYSGTKVDVSWRYHPDSGLEVRYTKK